MYKTWKKVAAISAALLLSSCLGRLPGEGDTPVAAGPGGDAAQTTSEATDDFTLFIRWGVFGISSYDSVTGRLVKTTDATDPSAYVTELGFSGNVAESVYDVIQGIDIFAYPDTYDPFNAPGAESIMGSEPNQTIVLKVRTGSREKTVSCPGIAYGSLDDCWCEEARDFMVAVRQIVSIITDTPEWQALPEYEFFYE